MNARAVARRIGHPVQSAVLGLGMVAFLLWLWDWQAKRIESPFMPPLHRIVDSFKDEWMWENIRPDLVPSMIRFVIGFGLALVIGVVGGILIGSIGWIRESTRLIVEFLRSLPTSTLVPFAIVVFGIGSSGKIFLVTFAATWPILINVAVSAESIDPVRLDVARSLHLPWTMRLRKLWVPTTTPAILAGARTSMAIALIMVVVSEMFGSTEGIGHQVLQAERSFRIANMWASVFVIGLVGFFLNTLFLLVERRILHRHGVATNSSRKGA